MPTLLAAWLAAAVAGAGAYSATQLAARAAELLRGDWDFENHIYLTILRILIVFILLLPVATVLVIIAFRVGGESWFWRPLWCGLFAGGICAISTCFWSVNWNVLTDSVFLYSYQMMDYGDLIRMNLLFPLLLEGAVAGFVLGYLFAWLMLRARHRERMMAVDRSFTP